MDHKKMKKTSYPLGATLKRMLENNNEVLLSMRSEEHTSELQSH